MTDREEIEGILRPLKNALRNVIDSLGSFSDSEDWDMLSESSRRWLSRVCDMCRLAIDQVDADSILSILEKEPPGLSDENLKIGSKKTVCKCPACASGMVELLRGGGGYAWRCSNPYCETRLSRA